MLGLFYRLLDIDQQFKIGKRLSRSVDENRWEELMDS